MPFAGCRSFEILDQETGLVVCGVALYPSDTAEERVELGPYSIHLAMNAPVAAGHFPLIVISHGTGGSPLVYRGLAKHLACHGYVVAMPEHPTNNRNDNSMAGTAVNLTNRPRHVRLVIDWCSSSGALGSGLRANTVAIIGHSLGGYTALAVAGGLPRTFPYETPDSQVKLIEVVPDDRVKALVLLAPATVWFLAPGSLRTVRMPILMLTAEKDPHTPPMHAAVVANGVPDRTLIEHRVVANAGHFSFLTPFPERMTNPAFAPSQDPAGFDRQKFQSEMNLEIAAFLDRVLSL